MDQAEFVAHGTSKFWFANSLGPLTVFPVQCATNAVCSLASSRRSWKRYRDDLVFCFPITSSGSKMSRKEKGVYGTALARRWAVLFWRMFCFIALVLVMWEVYFRVVVGLDGNVR